MNNIGDWLRRVGANITSSMRRFAAGRYGTDKLNLTILGTALVLCILNMVLGFFVQSSLVSLLLMLAYYFLLGWAIFRSFSRNTYKRYRENQAFLQFFDRLQDRQHRYYRCPKCRQSVRVPRGKGKIAITCPKCRERFIKST